MVAQALIIRVFRFQCKNLRHNILTLMVKRERSRDEKENVLPEGYLFGVGCGIAYNFYFKYSRFSPLPYALACAALPASIYLAVNRIPPTWILLSGSLLGVAFHFLNVLKDIQQDQESEIAGLPQLLGKKRSIAVIVVLLLIVFCVLIVR